MIEEYIPTLNKKSSIQALSIIIPIKHQILLEHIFLGKAKKNTKYKTYEDANQSSNKCAKSYEDGA